LCDPTLRTISVFVFLCVCGCVVRQVCECERALALALARNEQRGEERLVLQLRQGRGEEGMCLCMAANVYGPIADLPVDHRACVHAAQVSCGSRFCGRHDHVKKRWPS